MEIFLLMSINPWLLKERVKERVFFLMQVNWVCHCRLWCFFFCISGLYSDGFWKSGQQRKRWLEMRFQ